jgi:CheY-like chemotaxis protein
MGDIYTLAFLDVCMPGWSGDDVVSMLSNSVHTQRKFVVIVSGYLPDEIRRDFECHPNVLQILDKPFSTREVSAILQDAILLSDV